jgi:uncharacterized protein YcfJ
MTTMRPIALISGLAAAAAVSAAPLSADAACNKRTTGTVIGALAGGLLGNAVAGHGDRTAGTLIGAGAGGLVGNQVTKCGHARRAYYPQRHYSRAATPRTYAQAGSVCTYETRPYYDAYGRLVYAPSRVCR